MLRLIIVLVSVIVIVTFVTQLIIPIWKDTPIFPMFRKPTKKEKLQKELEGLDEFEEEQKLERQVWQRLAKPIVREPLEFTDPIQTRSIQPPNNKETEQ